MNSADKLLGVLGLFSEERPEWTAEEMIQETGFTRPTLYRYLKSLCETGLVTSVSGSAFSLGPRVTELDYLMRKADPLIRQGQAALVELTEQYTGSAFLVRWYERKILCVSSVASAKEPVTSYPRGRPMPLARGAISRAILAWLSKREQEEIGGSNLAEFARMGTGETVEEIRATLRRVRKEGVAIAHGEVTPGVVGIAAPILDAGSVPAAALCMTVAQTEVTPKQTADLASRVRDMARGISAKLIDHDNNQQSA
jgi:DNA-binding IclR family transcriptional regulator